MYRSELAAARLRKKQPAVISRLAVAILLLTPVIALVVYVLRTATH